MDQAVKQHLDQGLRQAVDNLDFFDRNLEGNDSIYAIGMDMIKMGVVNELMQESAETFFTGQKQVANFEKALEGGSGLRYFNENHIEDMDDEMGVVYDQEADVGRVNVGAVKSLLQAADAGDRNSRIALSNGYVQYSLVSKALEVWFAGGLMGKSKRDALSLLSPEVTPPSVVESFDDAYPAVFEAMGLFRRNAGY